MGLNITSRHSGSLNWLFHRISGVALAVILGLHFVAMHFISDGNYEYQTIMERMASPAWKALDVCFLFLALYHGKYGLQVLIDDYVTKAGPRNILFFLTWLLALFLFIYGTWIVLSLEAPPITG